MFWIWNNGEEIINIDNITYATIMIDEDDIIENEEITEEERDKTKPYADVWMSDRSYQPIELSKEKYLDLLVFIQNNNRR